MQQLVEALPQAFSYCCFWLQGAPCSTKVFPWSSCLLSTIYAALSLSRCARYASDLWLWKSSARGRKSHPHLHQHGQQAPCQAALVQRRHRGARWVTEEISLHACVDVFIWDFIKWGKITSVGVKLMHSEVWTCVLVGGRERFCRMHRCGFCLRIYNYGLCGCVSKCETMIWVQIWVYFVCKPCCVCVVSLPYCFVPLYAT